MSTLITFSPSTKPSITTLKNLVKQQVILENVSGSPGDPNLQNVARWYQEACQYWPATMAACAAQVLTDAGSTTALAALRETDAP